ncbi:MAG: M23 family metallopeptidase [bacterium]
MLSGKGTVLISQKQNEHLTYQIYDSKPEYIQILNQAALDLGYDSLLNYLKKNSNSIEFNGKLLYACTDELMDPKENCSLMISEDYQLFFFTELNDQKNSQAEKGLELSPLPKTKKAYEILLEFQQGENLIIPSHTDPNNDDYCLGLSYYSPEGEASGELWYDFTKNTSGTFQGLAEEYFFTNNTDSNIYNHSGRKYGFYISQDDLSIRYLEREGALDESQLSAWREEIKEKSLLYFLGLQHVESVHGSYSRRSAFIFNSKNELIMHYRTTEIGASHISDYIRIRLNNHLERIGENFSNIKILLADGDHNAQTYIPHEAFSDERLNSYGFHFILRPVSKRVSSPLIKTEDTAEAGSNSSALNLFVQLQSQNAEGLAASKLVKDLKKKLFLLNPLSILSGFWRYKSNPQELFTRIKNNISILSLNNEAKSGKREFEFRLDELNLHKNNQSKNLQVRDFLLNKKNLENFPHKSLINLITEPFTEKGFAQANPVPSSPILIYIKDFRINLKEIYKGYSTYILDEGTVAERTSSRSRRTNDRSVLGVHEDHEDDENAEIGVWQQCHEEYQERILAELNQDEIHKQSQNKKRLYLKTRKNIKVLNTEPEAFLDIKDELIILNIEEKNQLKQEKNNSHLKFDTEIIYPKAFCESSLDENQRKETEFLLAKLLFGFDTNHKLSSPYGLRSEHPITGETKFHHGVDYNALREQIIYAPLDLKICQGNYNKELGNYLIAEVLNLETSTARELQLSLPESNQGTREKLYILCAHLNEIPSYKEDQIILKNSPLCKAGSTGLSTAPHLHFETRFAKDWGLYFEAISVDPIIVFYYLLNRE